MGSPSIYNLSCENIVNDELELLIERCLTATGLTAQQAGFRANIFVPLQDKLKMLFDSRMEGDPDRGVTFDTLTTGLTGLCFITRQPQICNLQAVKRLREQCPEVHVFDMPRELQNRVRQDRTWLASVPIFDPYELRHETKQPVDQTLPPSLEVRYTHGIETGLDGPILGILNLDAGWTYDEIEWLDSSPEVQCRKVKQVQAILSLMQTTALDLGRTLAHVFPGAGTK